MIKISQNYIATIEKSMKQRLKSISQYSLMLNVWTSKHQQFFLEIIVYYINDQWWFQKLLLSFKSLLTKHTKWKMTNVAILFLIKYALECDLLTLTTDNALFNEILHLHLSWLMRQKFNVDWNYRENIICCMTHVMQLILKAIFKKLKISDEVSNEETSNVSAIKTIKTSVSWSNTIAKILSFITFIYHTNIWNRFAWLWRLSEKTLFTRKNFNTSISKIQSI